LEWVIFDCDGIVYGCCALTPAEHLRVAGAHQVFSSMSELPGLLAQ